MTLKEAFAKVMVLLDEAGTQNPLQNLEDYAHKLYPLFDSVQRELAVLCKPMEGEAVYDEAVGGRLPLPADCFEALGLFRWRRRGAKGEWVPVSYETWGRELILYDEADMAYGGTYTGSYENADRAYGEAYGQAYGNADGAYGQAYGNTYGRTDVYGQSDGFCENAYTLRYYAYPRPINRDTPEDAPLQIDPEAQEVLLHGVCAGVCMADEPELYNAFLDRYNTGLVNLLQRRQQGATATMKGGLRL